MEKVHLQNSSGYVQRIHARTHELSADEPILRGGTDAGPAPYELLLAGLAACTSITLRMYAERKTWELGEIDVRLQFLRTAEGAESISREVLIEYPLTTQQADRLAEICENTPVTKTIKRGTPIRTALRAISGERS